MGGNSVLSVQTDLDWLFLAMRKSSLRQNWGAHSGDRLIGNKSVENLAERGGFEPSVQVLARTTV
jgi:hypothetical protein